MPLLRKHLRATGGVREDRDHLGTDRHRADYAGLLAWTRYAGIAPSGDRLARHAQAQPRRAALAVAAALRLRGSIYAVFAAIAVGHSPAASDLAVLRDHFAEAIGAGVLRDDALPSGWTWPADDDVAGPLHAIAASAIELLTGSAVRNVKQCAGNRCWVLFVDTTKNRSRRWCQMRYCGNVVKSQRQAARRRQARA
jgi:predicted RNA-binding Zn ribbon-like protein